MKIEVGDEIWMKPLTHTMVVVTNLFEDGRQFDGIDRYGRTWSSRDVFDYTKTGRHFDIQGLLNQMKGDNSGEN